VGSFYAWFPVVFLTLFFAAVGASIGSLLNVLAYRMPRGEGVVTPPSRCPSCATRLTWRENIPVFGWVLLRGRCRFCKSRISCEYPLIEALVGVLFGGLFLVWFGLPGAQGVLGISVGAWSPEWAGNGFGATWPVFVVVLTLVASLVAMTLIDAKTFTIPLVLTWIPAGVALVVLPMHAGWVEVAHGPLSASLTRDGVWFAPDGWRWVSSPGWMWTLPTPGTTGWGWIGGALGGAAGLLVSLALLHLGWIGRSFADYDAWEAEVLAERERNAASAEAVGEGPAEDGVAPDLWVQYPHARREMIKEAAFLAPPVGLAIAGAWLAARWAMGAADPVVDATTGLVVAGVEAPLWLVVLSGVLWGYLVGGAVVWGVRVLGSLAFGKEAMGLGDVHLLAAVGACVGWIDAVLGFFAAAFVGLAWALVGALSGGKLPRALPYGPFLAVGTVLVVVCKPLVEAGLTAVLGATGGVDLP
jgi:leader peptidase (prepilin peptidase)/N-methyltransferase